MYINNKIIYFKKIKIYIFYDIEDNISHSWSGLYHIQFLFLQYIFSHISSMQILIFFD